MDFQKKKNVEDIFLWLWEAEERDDQSLSSFLVGERNGETREEYGDGGVTCCWSNQLLKVEHTVKLDLVMVQRLTAIKSSTGWVFCFSKALP